MILVHTGNPLGVWTGGPFNRFLSSFLSHDLQNEVEGFSVGMMILPPCSKSEPHLHTAARESWYVVEGEALVTIGEKEALVGPGDLVSSPANTMHSFQNSDPGRAFKALLILCPGGDEKNVTKRLQHEGGELYESEA